MGNVLSKLANKSKKCCRCCCIFCRCRFCCGLTQEEKIQQIYDQIRTEDIWDCQV